MGKDCISLVDCRVETAPADSVAAVHCIVAASNLEVILDLGLKGRAPHIVSDTDFSEVENIALGSCKIGAYALINGGNRLFQIRRILPHNTCGKGIVIDDIQILMAGGQRRDAENCSRYYIENLFHNHFLLH